MIFAGRASEMADQLNNWMHSNLCGTTRSRAWISHLLANGMFLNARKEMSTLLTKNVSRKRNRSSASKNLGQIRLVVSDHRSSKITECVNDPESDYKLHITMDKHSIMKLRGLRANLEASSDAEIIRRALKAYEYISPLDDCDTQENNMRSHNENRSEHIYVRVTPRMKEVLDENLKSSGRSYGEQVRQALRVLTQIVRTLNETKTGNINDINDLAKFALIA